MNTICNEYCQYRNNSLYSKNSQCTGRTGNIGNAVYIANNVSIDNTANVVRPYRKSSQYGKFSHYT